MNSRQPEISDRTIVDMLRAALPELLAVYIFGSARTPYVRPDSDLDLAVLSDHAEDPVFVWNLAQQLASVAGRDVDLIDLRRASAVFAAHVVVDGTLLFCADTNRCAAFEAYALANYARLNEERRGILEDIRATGKVHG